MAKRRRAPHTEPREEQPDTPRAAKARPPHRQVAPMRSPRELCTVHFAAERLKVHRKTVLRFIREGRLPANRIGKSYRIVRADLEAFAGVPPAPAIADTASVTSIVDVPGVGPELAQKWARTIPASLHAKVQGETPVRADVIYDPVRSHLKIVFVAAPADSARLLGMIRLFLEQLRA